MYILGNRMSYVEYHNLTEEQSGEYTALLADSVLIYAKVFFGTDVYGKRFTQSIIILIVIL